MTKVIDLFAGCGGLSLGFENAGFKILAAYDNWEPAIDVYERNFNDHPIYNIDLSKIGESVEHINARSADIIIGGPPCQDFSSAGKRDEKLGRADLTIIFAEIVSKIKPRFVVMENVERIIKSKALKEAIKIFREAKYGITTKILDASLCGVPQRRKRFFLIGELGGMDNFLDVYLDSFLSSMPLTVRGYLGDSLGIELYYRHPRSYMRRAVFSIDEPSPTVRGVNRPVPKSYKPHPGDRIRDIRNLRPLTAIERSYIQTFPKSFKFFGSKSDLEQMIGNAVPVKLAEYVGKCLSRYIREKGNGKSIVSDTNGRYILKRKAVRSNASRKIKRKQVH